MPLPLLIVDIPSAIFCAIFSILFHLYDMLKILHIYIHTINAIRVAINDYLFIIYLLYDLFNAPVPSLCSAVLHLNSSNMQHPCPHLALCSTHLVQSPTTLPFLAEPASIVQGAGALEVPHEVDAMAAILTGILLTLVDILLTRGACALTHLTHLTTTIRLWFSSVIYV